MGTSPATGQEMEWEESWNNMEPFSVTVVPTERDLFQDMQPVLTKTRKVGQLNQAPLFDISSMLIGIHWKGRNRGEITGQMQVCS